MIRWGDDDLGGQQVGVFDVVDDLAGGLDAQLLGVDVHAGQLRAGQAGKQRVVEGGDGQILGDAQPQAEHHPLQGHGQHVVAGHDGGGPLGQGEQGGQLAVVLFGQARALQDVLGADGQLVLGHGQQIAAFAVLGVVVLPLVRDVGDPPVAHLDQHGGQLPAGLDVVVVDVDGVLQVLFGLADQDVQHPLGLQIGKDGVVLPCVEEDEPLHPAAFDHGLDALQQFLVALAGEDGVGVLLLVAEQPDAPDGFEIEVFLIGFVLQRRQQDAEGAAVLSGQAGGLEVGLVPQLHHGPADLLFGLAADGRVIAAGAGDGGGGDPRQPGHIGNGCHCGASFHK